MSFGEGQIKFLVMFAINFVAENICQVSRKGQRHKVTMIGNNFVIHKCLSINMTRYTLNGSEPEPHAEKREGGGKIMIDALKRGKDDTEAEC